MWCVDICEGRVENRGKVVDFINVMHIGEDRGLDG